jgi:hypothetical protein
MSAWHLLTSFGLTTKYIVDGKNATMLISALNCFDATSDCSDCPSLSCADIPNLVLEPRSTLQCGSEAVAGPLTSRWPAHTCMTSNRTLVMKRYQQYSGLSFEVKTSSSMNQAHMHALVLGSLSGGLGIAATCGDGSFRTRSKLGVYGV